MDSPGITNRLDTSNDTTQVIAFLIKDFLSPLQVLSPVNEVICMKVVASATILLKLVQNALQVSSTSTTGSSTLVDEATANKYRTIRLSNKIIHEKVVTQLGAVDLLTTVGFLYEETDGEKYLIFNHNDGTNIGLASFFCVTLQEELAIFQKKEDEYKKSKMIPSVGDNEGNEFLSEKERKERQIKALKAKKAEKETRERAILRWNEDKSHRQEIEKRKQRAKMIFDSTVNPSATQVKIRKVSSQNPVNSPTSLDSNTPNESLESLRAKAQEAWLKKQNMNKKTKTVKMMDIDEKETIEDVEIKGATNENTNLHASALQRHEEDDENMISLKSAENPPINHIHLPNAEEHLSPSWEEYMEHIPRCGPSHNIRNTSVFYRNKGNTYATSSASPKCFRRLFAEFDELKSSLPADKKCSAWLRFDEETPQYIRALLTGPLPGPSPYAGGVFAFDIYIPDNYPMVCPKVNIVTTGRGTVRFGPNLYAEGKVCLSLLGTWSGPKWNPKHSSLHQVLVSIQGLLLGVEHPFFLEPGFGGWESKVKEGDFATVGHTLRGDTIKEDMKLPPQAWDYEDKIREGSIRYAMLEPLLLAARIGDAEIKPTISYLSPFEDIIKAHFYHNGNATLASVAGWLNASRPHDSTYRNASNVMKTFQNLFSQLEAVISTVCIPILEAKTKTCASSDGTSMDVSSPVASGRPKIPDEEPKSEIERLRERMQEAAQSSNFILAGQLQKQIKDIEEYEEKVKYLKAKITESASEGDYISAGDFQAQLKHVEMTNLSKGGANLKSFGDDILATSTNEEHFNHLEEDGFEDDEEEFGSEEDYDDEYETDAYKNSRWGYGQQLGLKSRQQSDGSINVPHVHETNATPKTDVIDSISRLPINDPCRLRIRISNSTTKTLQEVFDSSEKLSVLYKFVKLYISELPGSPKSTTPRLMQLRGVANIEGSQAIAVCGGAFANPYSEYGFTLLTTHPKREYSFEMHGSTSLKELGLTPSTTLTVMMCSSRGQVKRGILESKIGEAKGDAMDVDGLGYEALQELGEKIGFAAPGDGTWKGIDESALEKIADVTSPKQYLMQKSVQEDDTKCPICLGQFDTEESNSQLLVLKHCKHTFHSACLKTWLSTKTNCPLCNYSLSSI
mmetsp:Transcript_329/g.344  ORF Transcript_329/g.344 Transcript_329/m.344 type:complete len:1132 (-) Transcript_329:39-3434(-)